MIRRVRRMKIIVVLMGLPSGWRLNTERLTLFSLLLVGIFIIASNETSKMVAFIPLGETSHNAAIAGKFGNCNEKRGAIKFSFDPHGGYSHLRTTNHFQSLSGPMWNLWRCRSHWRTERSMHYHSKGHAFIETTSSKPWIWVVVVESNGSMDQYQRGTLQQDNYIG